MEALHHHLYPDSKVHGANMGPTWVLLAPGGPHVGPMNLAIWVRIGLDVHFQRAGCHEFKANITYIYSWYKKSVDYCIYVYSPPLDV